MRQTLALIFSLLAFSFSATAQDWSKPDLGSSKTNFMTEAHDLWNQCAKQDFTTGLNIPVGSLRYNRSLDLWQEFDGTTWNTAPISATALGSGGVTSSMIQDGTIATADIADNAITEPKIAAGAVGSSELADGSVTSTDIANGTIVGADLANGTITSTQVQDNTLTSDDIGSGAVGSDEISDNSIGSGDIGTNAVGSDELADNAVDNGALANNAVTGGKIQDGTVGSSDIQDNSLTADDIASSAIGSDEINNGAILGVDIGADTVSSANIGTGEVGNSEIADGAVTHAKLSGSWSSVSITSSTLFDCGASCGNGTGETGVYKYIQFGPMKYFYLDITYTFAGTSVDELGLELPIAAANANFTFFCTVGANNGEAVVGISNSGSTTQARLVKTSGNFGEGSGRNLKCSGFYE